MDANPLQHFSNEEDHTLTMEEGALHQQYTRTTYKQTKTSIKVTFKAKLE